MSTIAFALFTDAAHAIDVATGPLGANITRLQDPAGANLTGNGVTLGQVEGGRPGDINNPAGGPAEINHPDINPGKAVIGVSVVNRVMGVPTLVTPPASGAAIDDHATMVAGMMVSTNAARRGAAFNATLYSSAYVQTGAGTQRDAIVAFDHVRGLAGIINSSFLKFLDNNDYPAPGPAIRDGRSLLSQYIDYTARNNDTLFVQAGPEDTRTVGTMWDSYNNIVVSYTRRGANGRYDQLDGGSNQNFVIPDGGAAATRRKIDMCAPGDISNAATVDLNDDNTIGDTGFKATAGTSFAAPLVAGTAALLQQHATANALPVGHLRQKVTLLNAASKHVRDRTGVAWPVAREGRTDAAVLDPDTGVGQLNGVAAVRQQVPANRVDLGLREQKVNGGANAVYDLTPGTATLYKGSLVSATITWDRIVTNTGNGVNPILNLANYASTLPPDVELELLDATNTPVAKSISSVDNVEHVYFNVRNDGKYRLRVLNTNATTAADVAIAWSSGSVDGIAFGVRPGARGLTPNNGPSDVNTLGTFGAANFRTESEIFVGANGTNMLRLSGALQTRSRVGPFNSPPAAMSVLNNAERGVLGLRAGETAAATDSMGDFSWGTDTSGAILPNGEPSMQNLPTCLAFSVAGSGDVRYSAKFDPFGALYLNSTILIAPAEPNQSQLYASAASLGLRNTDDLDALDLTSPIQGDFAREADADGDGMQNNPVYFTLGTNSPSLDASRTTDDIFVALGQDPAAAFGTASPAAVFEFIVFAQGGTFGLQAGDVVDAIAICDVNGNGSRDAGDTALFSVAAGGASGLPGGNVYFTAFDNNNSLFASAAQLGIGGADLDALDVMAVIPEPGSLTLLAGLFVISIRRQQRQTVVAPPSPRLVPRRTSW